MKCVDVIFLKNTPRIMRVSDLRDFLCDTSKKIWYWDLRYIWWRRGMV